MARRLKYSENFGWRWFRSLLIQNAPEYWEDEVERKTYQRILADAIHCRCPYLDYEEILFRVELLYEVC